MNLNLKIQAPWRPGALYLSTPGWEHNIRMGLREIGYSDRDWIDLAHDRDQWGALVYTVMNLRVPRMLGIS
jgi:hypothetical protein